MTSRKVKKLSRKIRERFHARNLAKAFGKLAKAWEISSVHESLRTSIFTQNAARESQNTGCESVAKVLAKESPLL